MCLMRIFYCAVQMNRIACTFQQYFLLIVGFHANDVLTWDGNIPHPVLYSLPLPDYHPFIYSFIHPYPFIHPLTLPKYRLMLTTIRSALWLQMLLTMPCWFGHGCPKSHFILYVYHITVHDDIIKWNHFPRCWPFLRGIRRPPVNSPHKGQWLRALMFSLWSAPE